MPKCARNRDTNSHGAGAIISNVTNVIVNGRPISIVGNSASADRLCPISSIHCNPRTSSGSPNVFAIGIKVHRVGDSRVCGARTVTGSPNVFIN